MIGVLGVGAPKHKVGALDEIGSKPERSEPHQKPSCCSGIIIIHCIYSFILNKIILIRFSD